MKKTLMIFGLIATLFSVYGQTKQPSKKPLTTAKPAVSKFGALAIDRSNGFYYGWSFDYATLAEAEQKAIQECKDKGGNCTVVLAYSGTGCVAYRTVDGKVGTAFGWGLAKTKEEADAIASKECLKRSNGNNASNFVFSCSSANAGVLKEIYNASEEIIEVVKIGSQYWAAEDLDVAKFRNGDKIPQALSSADWQQFGVTKKPAYTIVLNKKIYNYYAIIDKRGLAPKGYHIPSDQEWEQLADFVGGIENAGTKLKSKYGWFEGHNGTNSVSFNGLPGGGQGAVINGGVSPREENKEGIYWSSTSSTSSTNYTYSLGWSYDDLYKSNKGGSWGLSVRLIKD